MSGKCLRYILLKNRMKNCTGYFPRTVPTNRYSRGDLINRMAEMSSFRASTCEGVMRLFEEALTAMLREGSSVKLDDFLTIMPRVKGSFENVREPFDRSRHSIVLEATVSNRFEQIVTTGMYVERTDPLHDGATIRELISDKGVGVLCPDYTNTIGGVKLAPAGYSVTGITLQVVDKESSSRPLMVGLDALYIASHKPKSLLFSFRRHFTLPEEFVKAEWVELHINYFNNALGKSARSGHCYVKLGQSEG